MRVLVLGDIHLPWPNWYALQAAAKFAEGYQPDMIVQVGDFVDNYNWSRYPKAPDAPSASEEWYEIEKACERFDRLFPGVPIAIVEGNHDRRLHLRAFDANIPEQLLKPYSQLFPYDNWYFHIEAPEPLVVDGVNYVHGDEGGGQAVTKSRKMGEHVVQGHLHKIARIEWTTTHMKRFFGMDVGCLLDQKAICARYGRKALLQSWIGWATVTDGRVPELHPYFKKRETRSRYMTPRLAKFLRGS